MKDFWTWTKDWTNKGRSEWVQAWMNERKEQERITAGSAKTRARKTGSAEKRAKYQCTVRWSGGQYAKNHIHDTQGAAYSENVQAVRGHTHSQICHKEACCQQARSGGGINMWRRDKWMKTWANEPTQYQKREERAVRLNMCAWIRELLLEVTSALSYLWPDLPLLWSIFSLSSVFPGQRLLWILRG